MPIDVKFDEEKRLLRVTISGAWPTLPEIVAERSRLILAGIIRPGVVELVDARKVTKGIPNLSQMQAILHSISNPPLKRAIIVSSTIDDSSTTTTSAFWERNASPVASKNASSGWNPNPRLYVGAAPSFSE